MTGNLFEITETFPWSPLKHPKTAGDMETPESTEIAGTMIDLLKINGDKFTNGNLNFVP
jgi:hypothetical protein